MRAVKIDLPSDLKMVEIHTFADLHIGDKFCDMDTIKRRIEYVKNTENAYIILNGDLCNNATKTSVSDSYAELLSPMQQITSCVELFKDVKNKILCCTSGNHENRTYNKEGIDITQIVCTELGIADRYSKTSALIFLRVGAERRNRKVKNKDSIRPITYSILSLHGSGGGRKEGAKAIRLADMASIVDADIYIHSHTHLPMVMKQSFYRTDVRSSTFAMVDKLFVNTSAMLDYGGYGEAFEYKPASKDCPIVYLSGTKKYMTATL